MASSLWTPVADGNTATWDKNKARADLERASITYDSAVTTYDSATIFYDGYDPTIYTPEGEDGALWTEVVI